MLDVVRGLSLLTDYSPPNLLYLLEQYVLRLDVAVDDAVRVHECEHVDELPHHVLRVPA